ncbi:MAG: hypothetical protein IKA77_03875 [Clostridia bacterium]|nr:hypothetical protein [Clostridia bacterium]
MNDTIKLLKECDAGVQMGVSSINDVLDYVHSESLKSFLAESKAKHNEVAEQIKNQLLKYNADGKAPNPMAKGMSWMKTNVKLSMDESDATVADLITDGCNMGVKSLNRYLNQYTNAEEEVKELTKRLIDLEEKLAIDIRRFL